MRSISLRVARAAKHLAYDGLCAAEMFRRLANRQWPGALQMQQHRGPCSGRDGWRACGGGQ